MFLTPKEPREELRALAILVQAQLENITRIVEIPNLRGLPAPKTVKGKTHIISMEPPDPGILEKLDVSRTVFKAPEGLPQALA